MDILEHLGMKVPDIEGHGVIISRANGSQQRDFETGSHNSAPQVTRNIRRINNRFNVIVKNLDNLLDTKGAF